ncbi:MAG TPA: HD domain-containing phosphohydrolase [Euzebya sp.]|nr:HD domain-containing phosphohydrolase [Euzebya sp.]
MAALSLAVDLGLGQPQEHVMRQTLIAQRLAELAGLAEDSGTSCFFVSMLAWVGCTADSHDLAQIFGDDIGARAATYGTDMAGLPLLRFLAANVGRETTPLRRIRLLGTMLATGGRALGDAMVGHCEATSLLAAKLGLGVQVCQPLLHSLERWDGKGAPGLVGGDVLAPIARVVHLADIVEVAHREEGIDGAVAVARRRRGTQFDPTLVDLFAEHAGDVLGGLDDIDMWVQVVQDGPSVAPLDEAALEEALGVVADLGDLKCTWRVGRSRIVAAEAAEGARRLGLSEEEIRLTRHAGLVQDVGVIGVSNRVWDKPAPLSAGEWERVRTHPYLTERTLARPPALAAVGALAGFHHERLDGSGYPRGLSGAAIPMPARLLAAADVHHALREDRPHRPALAAAAVIATLRAEVAAGRLDGDAVDAVLDAAGQRRPHRAHRRTAGPCGLTGREVAVLGLLARGLSNRQMAAELVVSPKTVGTHIEHVYNKIGVSSRAAATLFAVHHGLVTSDEP